MHRSDHIGRFAMRFSGCFLMLGLVSPAALAVDTFPGLSPQGDTDSVRESVKEPGYSPYAGRNFPTRVY